MLEYEEISWPVPASRTSESRQLEFPVFQEFCPPECQHPLQECGQEIELVAEEPRSALVEEQRLA